MKKSISFLSLSSAFMAIAAATASAASAEELESAGVESSSEILVTAQKRTENLQDVPISISVVSGEDLVGSGATQLVDFGAYVPGLQVDSAGTPGQVTVSLRGIAPIGPSATVGTYLDDVPVGSSTFYARSAGFTLDLLPYDIERIEVLRGPQGTLYGASSIGGLLKYVTTKPSLDGISGKVGGEVFTIRDAGNLGYAGRALVNAALVPGTLGVTASYAYRSSPGFVDSVTSGVRDQNSYNQEGGRLALLWKPDDRLTVNLSGLWQTIDADGNAIVAEDLVTGERLGDGLSYNNYIPEDFRKSIDHYAVSIDYDLGFANLSSASSYNHSTTYQVGDTSRSFGVLYPLFGADSAGISKFTLELDLEKYTQEIRLASPSGQTFEWLIGGFYTYEKSGNRQVLNAFDFDGVVLPGLDPFAVAELPTKYEEVAFFANGTIAFSDRFDISAGVRWARNFQDFRQISTGAIVPTADVPGKSKESVWTYSVSPQFHINDDAMLYARVATGYRPGGPNAVLPNVPPIVFSDSLTNYEVGLKAAILGRSVTVDVAAFRMDWDDIQLTLDFNGVTGLSNAGRARSQGLEASLVWEPIGGLRLGANGAYTDATLREDSPPGVPGLKGDRLPRIPKWSGSLTADYGFELSADATMSIGAGFRTTGDRLSNAESSPRAVVAEAYSALDMNAAVTISDRYTIRLFARNVTDSNGAISRDLQTDGFGTPTFISVVPLQPRTVGLAFDASF